MLLHLQPFALFQAPVHVSQNLAFHPATTHDVLPFWPTSTALLAAPRGGLVPLAAFHTPETTAISARSPSIPKSSKSLRNPAPGTCAAAPPPAVFPAISQSRAGSSSSASPRSGAARCSGASQRHPAPSRRHPQHPPSPSHPVRFPSADNGCPAPSSKPGLSR